MSDVKAEMRVLVVAAHAGQQRNAGRVPYAAHVLSVGEILQDALLQGGECHDAALLQDLYLAALGHDLYEDTDISPADIRQRFGDRVDVFIESMTNRAGDHDRAAYEARMRGAEEEVRLVKLADLVDNVVSCAYGIHDLGYRWVKDTFLRIAVGMTRIVEATRFERFPKTAELLLGWLRFGLMRLRANLAIHLALDARPSSNVIVANSATWDGVFKSDPGDLEIYQECERRQGWLLQGMQVFPVQDS
ncbi:MAG TPA: hypothetical protein PLF40_02045 [Kofleriaceae bacterium]|nr:hypothetical protein [Kofleriaceae bacterium]